MLEDIFSGVVGDNLSGNNGEEILSEFFDDLVEEIFTRESGIMISGILKGSS